MFASHCAVAVGAVDSQTPQNPLLVQTFGGERLFAAAFAQLATAQQQRDYSLWPATLLLLSNCCRFSGEQGSSYRASLILMQRGEAADRIRVWVCCGVDTAGGPL